jgi:hypothetical protein
MKSEASRRIEEHGHKRFPQDEWINTVARDTSSRNTRPDVYHVRRPPVYSTNVAVASRKNMMDFKRYRGWLRSSQCVALATTSSIQQQITITQRQSPLAIARSSAVIYSSIYIQPDVYYDGPTIPLKIPRV